MKANGTKADLASGTGTWGGGAWGTVWGDGGCGSGGMGEWGGEVEAWGGIVGRMNGGGNQDR